MWLVLAASMTACFENSVPGPAQSAESACADAGAAVPPECLKPPECSACPDPPACPQADAGEGCPPPCECPVCPAPERTLRVMTFNIRHAAEASLGAIANVIKAEAPDIVGLQEVDYYLERSGNVYQSYRLGQLVGRASLFRASIIYPDSGGQYGLAVLSRFPIVSSDKLVLTSGAQPRILLIVDIELEPGRMATVAVTHLGLTAEERRAQAAEIVEALRGRPRVLLMGDFNEGPTGSSVRTLTAEFADVWDEAGQGAGFTFPADAPTMRIDFILRDRALPVPIEAHVPERIASDHRPVVVTMPWPAQ
jgi:endonuclease/exonuclease/phosphatase family metal-dependent hydrolase